MEMKIEVKGANSRGPVTIIVCLKEQADTYKAIKKALEHVSRLYFSEYDEKTSTLYISEYDEKMSAIPNSKYKVFERVTSIKVIDIGNSNG